jgi:hypothetical protein
MAKSKSRLTRPRLQPTRFSRSKQAIISLCVVLVSVELLAYDRERLNHLPLDKLVLQSLTLLRLHRCCLTTEQLGIASSIIEKLSVAAFMPLWYTLIRIRASEYLTRHRDRSRRAGAYSLPALDRIERDGRKTFRRHHPWLLFQ